MAKSEKPAEKKTRNKVSAEEKARAALDVGERKLERVDKRLIAAQAEVAELQEERDYLHAEVNHLRAHPALRQTSDPAVGAPDVEARDAESDEG